METSGADHIREAPEAPPPPEPPPPPPESVAHATGEHHGGLLGGISRALAETGVLKGVGDVLPAGVGDQLGKLITGSTGDLIKSLEKSPSQPQATPATPEADWQQKFSHAEAAAQQMDAAEHHAQELIGSPNAADQLKGQQEMQRMQQTMEALTKQLKEQGDTAKRAIGETK